MLIGVERVKCAVSGILEYNVTSAEIQSGTSGTSGTAIAWDIAAALAVLGAISRQQL